jgi:hypothetical protein
LFLLKSPAITTPTHSYSASTLSTHEVPPKSRTPLPDLSGFRQDHPCGGTEVAAECWLAVGLSWPGGTKKGRRSKRRPAPKNATSPLGGVSLDEGRSSVSIQPNRKGGFYLHGDGSPRFIATFQQSSNKRPRLIHRRPSLRLNLDLEAFVAERWEVRARIDKARTAIDGSRRGPSGPVCAARLCYARQHTLIMLLLTLNVKPASQEARRRPLCFLSPCHTAKRSGRVRVSMTREGIP